MGTQNEVDAPPPVGDEDASHHSRSAADVAYVFALGERIREVRGKRSRADLANKLHIHVNTLGKFERGESMPDALLVNRICTITGHSVEWLVTGRENAVGEPERSLVAVERGRYLYVPLFDVQASAGPGAFVDLERVVTMRPFDVNYIRGDLRIAHNEVALLGITGSSSEPALRSGDTVMVDRRDREVQAEGLHLLRIDDVLLVKMVQRLPGRALRVSSTNDAYQPFDIRMDGEDETNVNILGRVRWGGVTFR